MLSTKCTLAVIVFYISEFNESQHSATEIFIKNYPKLMETKWSYILDTRHTCTP